jgi:hypothetical protein
MVNDGGSGKFRTKYLILTSNSNSRSTYSWNGFTISRDMQITCVNSIFWNQTIHLPKFICNNIRALRLLNLGRYFFRHLRSQFQVLKLSSRIQRSFTHYISNHVREWYWIPGITTPSVPGFLFERQIRIDNL